MQQSPMEKSQQESRRRRWGRASAVAVVAAALVGVGAFSASEAWAARSAVFTSNCGQYNWCAPSLGGDGNCNQCCTITQGSPGGFCFDYRESTELQGCICFS